MLKMEEDREEFDSSIWGLSVLRKSNHSVSNGNNKSRVKCDKRICPPSQSSSDKEPETIFQKSVSKNKKCLPPHSSLDGELEISSRKNKSKKRKCPPPISSSDDEPETSVIVSTDQGNP